MAQRLGRAAKNARRAAGITLLEVATYAEVSQTTVHDFEAKDGWRRDTDEIVRAYELLCGLPPDELWRRALNDEAPTGL